MGLKEEFERQVSEEKTKTEELKLTNQRKLDKERLERQKQENKELEKRRRLNEEAKAQFDESGLNIFLEDAVKAGMAKEIDYKTYSDGTKMYSSTGQHEVRLIIDGYKTENFWNYNGVDVSVSQSGSIVIKGNYEAETLVSKKEWKRNRAALEIGLVKAIRKPFHSDGPGEESFSGDGRNGR